jgi:asparagine synthetase B (glutamine-hydrolysing)
MCGIFSLFNKDLLKKLYDKCSHRGPDNITTVDLTFHDKDIYS